MLKGQCFRVSAARSLEPLNETTYRVMSKTIDELTLVPLTISNALAGLLLNILSLVVFLRVFRRSGSRNNFHLFFMFLTVCEITFCMGSALSYTIAMLSHKTRIRWVGFDPLVGNTTRLDYYYSTYLPAEDRPRVTAFYLFLSFSNYLAVLSQFSRNCWVGLTALLRSYVATRRTSVQAGRTFTLARISGMFATKVAIVLALGGVRAYVKDPQGFLRPEFHVCDTAGWVDGGSVLLHVPMGIPPLWHTVNMLWTLLSQTIPLLVILFSSIVLIASLRRGNAVGNSSERNKRVTRMVFIFALAFALLEGPRAAFYLLEKFVVTISDQDLKLRVSQITYFLSLTDSSVNVFIYFFNDQYFRKQVCQCGGSAAATAGQDVTVAASTVAASPVRTGRRDSAASADELKPLKHSAAADNGACAAVDDDGTRV